MIIRECFHYATSALQRSAPTAVDTAVVAMSLYVVLHNKVPLSKWFGSALSFLACATLAALAVYSSSVAWTSLLYSFAVLMSHVLSFSAAGYIWFQAFHLLGAYRVLSGSSSTWSQVACALLHGVLVLINLDSTSRSLLNQVYQQCTYAQERYLMKLQKLRQVTVDDLWPLPERYQLRTAYRDFKLDTSESYFVIRAIFRMMWRPMIPVYIVGLLLQLIPLLQIKLNSNIMCCVDDLSNYSMSMIVADVARVVIIGILVNQESAVRKFIYKELARAGNAIDIVAFRLPLQRMELMKKSDSHMSSRIIVTCHKRLPQDIERLLSLLFSVAVSVWMLYNHIGSHVITAMVMPQVLKLAYLGIKYFIGSRYKWMEYRESSRVMSDISGIPKTIELIKVFAWEKTYPSLPLKPGFLSRKKLPWYAPAMRLLWTLMDTVSPIVNQLSILGTIYTLSKAPSMANVAMPSATIIEVDALFQKLQSDIGSLSNSISGFKHILRENQKVEAAFRGEYLNSLPHSDDTTETGPLVEINNCSFAKRIGNNTRNALSDVTISASAGDLVAIVGKPGAGKSSLLLAMCSEMQMTQGTGRLVGTIAYLGQQPWIMNDTLRANILFGRDYEEDYYWKVLHACALTDDLEIWPSGDMTVVGKSGIKISGGQRARLALARTVYSKADIYFLDDPLSAVDSIVKQHILDNIILSTGLLGDKLRFVTTNADNILPLCNQVATVEGGCVSVKVQTPQVHIAFKPKGTTVNKSKKADCTINEQPAALESMKIDNKSSTSTGPITNAKPQKQWSHWSNAFYAVHICGWPVVVTVILTVLFRNIMEAMLYMYRIGILRSNSRSSTANSNAMLAYIGTMIMGSITSSLTCKLQLFVFRYLKDDIVIQRAGNHLIKGLLFAPLSYFEGKQDREISSEHNCAVYTFTVNAFMYLSYSLTDLFLALFMIYRVTRSSPWLLACIPMLLNISRVTSFILKPFHRGLKKLSKMKPDENECIDGLFGNGAQTIRLFDVEPHFTNTYIRRAESKARLDMVKSTYSNLEKLVSSVTRTVLHSILLYVYITMSKVGLYTIRAGDVAEFRQNCKSIASTIPAIFVIRRKTLELLAKINEFRNLAERDPEAPYVVDSCRPSTQWPPNGKVEFRDFSVKHGADLGYALRNINLTINPGEKISIVGRTGAGKSSLVKALFRLVHENTSGSILIDGQDISEFGVGDYRPRLAIIPQDSTMLEGSIRHNLDPLNQFDIEQIWASLIKCNMVKSVTPYHRSRVGQSKRLDSDNEGSHAREQWQQADWLKRVILFILNKMPRSVDTSEHEMPHGLDKAARWCYGGVRSGKQQLFALCRVIMRKPKIVVLDEATANVDLETNTMVQELIRKELKDCTVLTIAHRLETIMNSDRIIVMDKGTIAGIGAPQDLLAKDGIFAQLVKTSDFGQ